jgi:hypothetical protein
MDILHERALAEDKERKESRLRAAKEIFEKDLVGPEEVEGVFRVHLKEEDIPMVPFTVAQMVDAQREGQALILRIDTADDGEPLTVQEMADRAFSFSPGAFALPVDPSLRQERPRAGWALVTKQAKLDEPILWFEKGDAEKKGITILDKLTILVEDKAESLPKNYQAAIAEFKERLPHLKELEADTARWPDLIKELSKLQIVSMTQRTTAEAIYDFILNAKRERDRNQGREKIFSNRYFERSVEANVVTFQQFPLKESGVVHVFRVSYERFQDRPIETWVVSDYTKLGGSIDFSRRV